VGGALVPRGEPGALLHEPAAIVARSIRMATEGTVEAVDGAPVPVDVRSLCVHGDTPGAGAVARAVRAGLEGVGVRVVGFAVTDSA
ncbi:MAG: LamB/YcsF family protein, partial [Geodermatophilaceae bacterium]|nr:LamB/YcsF family protein [Geodermatophilaceae bacterium]